MLVQLQIKQPVVDGHRNGRAVESLGDRALQVVESGFDDCLDRRRQIAAVIGEDGRTGTDLGESRWRGRIHPEAVVEPPRAQAVADRGEFRMGARVGVFGEHAAIRRQ